MKTALLSVSDTTWIVPFAQDLISLDYQIIATQGTYKKLVDAWLAVQEVSKMTKFPEILSGRVKTLHPKIHGGILAQRDDPQHMADLQEHTISLIDLVCVNLYPFQQLVQKNADFKQINENIDVWGHTLIRAAAKNSDDVLVITEIEDYTKVIDFISRKVGWILSRQEEQEFRQRLKITAFEHTAMYDVSIVKFLQSQGEFPFWKKYFIVWDKVFDAKYGENPHQQWALYQFGNEFTQNCEIVKWELSYNNILDIYSSIKLASSFWKLPNVAIVKHGNPCGFALGSSLSETYSQALKCDSESAFWGVVAINGVLDEALALEIKKAWIFTEVIVAADITPAAKNIFATNKRIKLVSQKREFLKEPTLKYEFRSVDGGFLIQEVDKVRDDEVTQGTLVTEKSATSWELQDLEIANKIAAYTKSNSIVFVRDRVLLAIGMWMTSRIDAVKAAVSKARKQQVDLRGSVLASEAFFPFDDVIRFVSAYWVTAISQPWGSTKDTLSIEAANKFSMSMYFTWRRHFLH